jgi:hypothetical protein
MIHGESLQNAVTLRSELQDHITSIGDGMFAVNQARLLTAFTEFNDGVMP